MQEAKKEDTKHGKVHSKMQHFMVILPPIGSMVSCEGDVTPVMSRLHVTHRNGLNHNIIKTTNVCIILKHTKIETYAVILEVPYSN